MVNTYHSRGLDEKEFETLCKFENVALQFFRRKFVIETTLVDNDVWDWIRGNCTDLYYIKFNSGTVHIFFLADDDATGFKLRYVDDG